MLLDTSVVIALARGELSPADVTVSTDELAVSAITIAGLHHGVLVASPGALAPRLHALRVVEESCTVLPVDATVGMHYGRLAADARRLLGRRVGLGDGLIAATALAHRLPVVTRDRDFEAFADHVTVVFV
jgi:predicted nucleic acid-binding protein